MLLERISINFPREYVNKCLVEFARNNPEIAVYVRERNGKHPRIVANYCKYCLNECFSKGLFTLYREEWAGGFSEKVV